MNIICLIAATFMLTVFSVSMKKVPQGGGLRLNLLVTGSFTALIFLFYLVSTLASGEGILPRTYMWGAIWGAVYVTTVTLYFMAMQRGPLSYTGFMFSSSMMIPILYGALIWKESVTPMQWAGVALFLTAFYLVSVPGADRSRKGGRVWLVLSLLTMCCNGALSVLLKAQQLEAQGGQSMPMLAVSFGTAGVLSFIVYAVVARVQKEKLFPADLLSLWKKSLPAVVCISVSNGAANGLVAYLSSRMAGALLYPFAQGGSLVLMSLYSIFALKEKINRWGCVGLLCGIAAMVAINL